MYCYVVYEQVCFISNFINRYIIMFKMYCDFVNEQVYLKLFKFNAYHTLTENKCILPRTDSI